MKTSTSILTEIKKLIAETTRINFKNHTFILKLDTNDAPNKKGIKIQFIPTNISRITPTAQDDIAMEMQSKLDQGLQEYGLRVERDRDLKNKHIIGFFIYIEYFSKIVRKALEQSAASNSPE